MNSPYDWEREADWRPVTEPSPPVVDWADHALMVANAQLQRRPRPEAQPRINPVTGHGMDCRCSRCPGWYADRAQRADHGSHAPSTAPQPRAARPLVDTVLPVSVLMCVFTICAMVLLPVITPLVALSALSLGLVAICIAVIAVVGLSLAMVVRRTARDAGGARVVRGTVVRR